MSRRNCVRICLVLGTESGLGAQLVRWVQLVCWGQFVLKAQSATRQRRLNIHVIVPKSSALNGTTAAQ
jgi:hypothetical protein